MRVPVSVPIGGRNVTIEYPEQIFDDDGVTPLAGATLGEPIRCQVSKCENASGEATKSTLFHELIHVALQMTGQTELLTEQQEEGIVRAIEYMLGPVLAFKANSGIKYKEIEFPWE